MAIFRAVSAVKQREAKKLREFNRRYYAALEPWKAELLEEWEETHNEEFDDDPPGYF